MIERRKFLLGMGSLIASPSIAVASNNVHMSEHDLHILAKTVYGEARGEHESGMIGVANSVFNRVTSKNNLFKHDTSISKACLRSEQYSCWLLHKEMNHIDIHSEEFKNIIHICKKAYSEYKSGIDRTNHATHYYWKHIKKPFWVCDMKKTVEINNHIFFKPKV